MVQKWSNILKFFVLGAALNEMKIKSVKLITVYKLTYFKSLNI